MTASFLNGVNCLMNGMNMKNIMKGWYNVEVFGAFLSGIIVGFVITAIGVAHAIIKEDEGSDDIL